MALLFTEGFDAYADIAEMVGKWHEVQAGGTIAFEAGLYGGNAVKSDVNTSRMHLDHYFSAPQTTVVVGQRLKFTGDPGIGTTGVYSFYDGLQIQFYIDSTSTPPNTLQVKNGNGQILGTFTYPVDAWFYLEIKVNFHATTGSVVVRVDEAEVLNLTNVDTVNNSGGNQVTRIRMGGTDTFGVSSYHDDLYVLNTDGATANDFLGDSYVETLFPTADNSVAWTRSGGAANFEMVDDATPDDDTTYVSSSTAAQQDLYDFGDLSAGVTTVHGVMVNARHRRENSGARFVKLLSKSGVDEQESAQQQLYLGYTASFALFTTKDGTNAWAPADVDAAQFGFELV